MRAYLSSLFYCLNIFKKKGNMMHTCLRGFIGFLNGFYKQRRVIMAAYGVVMVIMIAPTVVGELAPPEEDNVISDNDIYWNNFN